MFKYQVSFSGRPIGALSPLASEHLVSVVVVADGQEAAKDAAWSTAAVKKAYDTHEHLVPYQVLLLGKE